MAALVGGYGPRFFVRPEGASDRLPEWSLTEKVARVFQYTVAAFIGRVIQFNPEGTQAAYLEPSRLKLLIIPTALIALGVLAGLQTAVLVAAVVFAVASIVSIAALACSETQNAYNTRFENWVHEQHTAGQITGEVETREQIERFAKDLAQQVKDEAWYSSGTGVAKAMRLLVRNCKNGTTELVVALLSSEEGVFENIEKRVGDFLMGKMTNRHNAQEVMTKILAATPKGDVQQARMHSLLSRIARKVEQTSGTDWASEICDAVKGKPMSLAAVLEGLSSKRGGVIGALARGFNLEDLAAALNRGKLEAKTLGAIAVALEADDDRVRAYSSLQLPCAARLADAIVRIDSQVEEEGGKSPRTVEFEELPAKEQTQWLKVSLADPWLKELGANVALLVVMNAVEGDLAKVDQQFLGEVLQRLISEGSSDQAATLLNLASVSTLQDSMFRQGLDPMNLTLLVALAVKQKLDGGLAELAIRAELAGYAEQLKGVMNRFEDLAPRLLWRVLDGEEYPSPADLSEENAVKFYGMLPTCFKARVTGLPADFETSEKRLMKAAEYLAADRQYNFQNGEAAFNAFVGSLDIGQKAIIENAIQHLPEGEPSQFKERIGADTLMAWKGGVGKGMVYNGYLE